MRVTSSWLRIPFLNKLIEKGQLSEDNLHPFRYYPNKNDYGLEGYNEEFDSFGGKFDILLFKLW